MLLTIGTTHRPATDLGYLLGKNPARTQTFDLPLGDRAREYVALLLEHPAMKAWYQDALAEPWREIHHEEEIIEAGRVIRDYRQA